MNPYVAFLTGHGFAVFPLMVNAKRPAQARWQQAASTSPSIASMYFSVQPFNYGVVTGAPSAGLVVVDCDTAESADAIAPRLPPTLSVRTPHGMHYYLRTTKRCKTMVGLLPSIDIRGEGGLVVGPGSHIDGVDYIVSADLPVALMPPWLEEMIPEPSFTTTHSAGFKPIHKCENENPMFLPVVSQILEAARFLKPGERNRGLFQLACQLAEFVAAGVVLSVRLDQLSKAAGDSGLDMGEASRTVNSAWRTVTGKSRKWE